MKFFVLFWLVMIGACCYDKVRADFGNKPAADGTTLPNGLPYSPPVPGNWAPYNLGTPPTHQPPPVRTNSASPAKLPTIQADTRAPVPVPVPEPGTLAPTPPDGWKSNFIDTSKLHTFAITTAPHWMLTVKGDAYNKADTNDPNTMQMIFTGADGSRWLATWKREPAPKK